MNFKLFKIIYLVGWQYNGHNDKYPAFFEVNRALKWLQDKDAMESLLWLMIFLEHQLVKKAIL